MIRATVYRRTVDQSFKGLRILGHAGYEQYGKDIVCAGVSALVVNLVNAIEQLTDDPIVVQTDEAQGLIEFKFCRQAGHDATLLMQACIMGLEAIQQEHSDYIRLLFKEV